MPAAVERPWSIFIDHHFHEHRIPRWFQIWYQILLGAQYIFMGSRSQTSRHGLLRQADERCGSLGVDPPNLTQLSFDPDFNQPLATGVLPASLPHLSFPLRALFNQPLVEGVLFESLTHLTFGIDFNQPLVTGALWFGFDSTSP